MSIILNIDTSLETASVSIAKEGALIVSKENKVQKEHASFLHLAIQDLLTESSLGIDKIEAIAVTNGPGSYTGLRVGLASAKGLCFALNKPLITIGSLNVLASSAIGSSEGIIPAPQLYCPMIDARRMEIYTAVFDRNMKEILPPCAMILNEHSFHEMIKENSILFFGNGSEKWKGIVTSKNAAFTSIPDTIPTVCRLSFEKFINSDFTDLTYSEPLYIKEFFTP
jgi:tRNA threonylcarbamoyladenosine biosynthesis protein TsaB